MKHFILLMEVYLVSIFCVNAQNWQTVRSGRIAYFDNDQGQIKCIRIDSVSFDKDSVLYPMPNIQQTGERCLTPKGNSWMGKKFIIQSNGDNLFFNNNDDTILINTRAKAGESWTFFEIKDSIKVTAEVLSAEIQTILGETDSIKTIGFKVYNKNGQFSNHPVSDKSLIISKDHGFIKILNLNFFPQKPEWSYEGDLQNFSLIGLTNPDRGVQNLTWLRVHDYQVGDELHIAGNSWNWSVGSGYRYELKTIWKILERESSNDSVFYRIERKELLKKIIEKWDNISYTFTHDTITQVYKPDSLFDKLPGEPIVIDNGADTYDMINNGTFINKSKNELVIRHIENDSCWYRLIWDGGGPGYYLKGLGGPYYEWNEIINGDDRALVYYKKGSSTWGTPLVITGVESLENADQISVYPNPASDFITIENRSGQTEKYLVSLTNMQGREIFKNETVISTTFRLDISSLKAGSYLLKLQNKEKQVSRLIVKKP